MRWEIHQLDIKTSSLNGVVKEEVYIEDTMGVETHDMKNHVCKLKKDLYELIRNPWDNTYMRILRSPRVMKILTFATRLKMKSYRG